MGPDWPESECKIAFVGEAPGTMEVRQGRYFAGKSGKLLRAFNARAGIPRANCLYTNVLDFQLPDNEISKLPGVLDAKGAREAYKNGPDMDTTEFDNWIQVPVESGVYVPPRVIEDQLGRLKAELDRCRPNVVVACGATAVWALLCAAPYGKMRKLRGTIAESPWGYKVIPTYHPAYIHRNYHHSPLFYADLCKARREMEYPGIYLPERKVEVCRSVDEVRSHVHRLTSRRWPAACDIETAYGQIDCIGFADGPNHAFVVPFAHLQAKTKKRPGLRNYWPTEKEEVAALIQVARLLDSEACPKVFQNGVYDVNWIWEEWGVRVRNWTDDTRLLHHSLWPELPGDLATIASLHLTVPAWKLKGRLHTKPDE